MPVMPPPVLITTDLDRTLIFSRRATAELGGALPAYPVESTGGQSAGELCHAARDCLTALPARARVCVATSRSISRLNRLRLPFAAPYAIAANGGVVLIDGVPDPRWSARIAALLARAAPAAEIRAVLAGPGGRGRDTSGTRGLASPPWLERMGDDEDMCALAIVRPALLAAGELAGIAARCAELGWDASLIGRKLYAFPAGFGKEQAVAFVARRVTQETGTAPLRFAAGDTEHDRAMLAGADLAWVPAGSELAARCGSGDFQVTRLPGHAAAAQITRDWLDRCARHGPPV